MKTMERETWEGRVPLTTSEFNEKWGDHLEEGHYGMAIGTPEVLAYLDGKFKELSKLEGFTYSQVKTKFGATRFYCSPNSVDSRSIEEEIDLLLIEKSWKG
jgi:hypothetical protein